VLCPSLDQSAQAPRPGALVSALAPVSAPSVRQQGGQYGVGATNTVFTALGLPLPGGYDSNGNFVGVGPYDGVILLNIDQPLSYSQPVPAYDGSNLTYDGTRAFEHEIDEVLGGGGSGSTLNDVADYGLNNPLDPFTFYQGALDL
jgi:hypothetical protein